MYPQQNGRIPYFSKISIVIVPVLIVGIFFTVQLARMQQQGSIGAWYTSQAATAKCDASGATIGVSFTNTETDKSLGMNVIAKDVQTGTSVDMGSIAAGQTKTAMIVSGKQKLSANGVVFSLTWTSGKSGTDSRSAAYTAISCSGTTPLTTPTSGTTASSVDVTGKLTVYLHGIGHSGDNTNPDQFSMSNQKPLHPNITADVQLYNPANQLIRDGTSTLTYNAQNGNYTGSITISPDVIPNGKFNVKIKVPYHLRTLLPGIQSLPSGEHTTDFASVSVVLGDADNSNSLTILDYNMILDCYSDLQAPVACNDTKKTASDFNDDGAINQIDYNLFLRELATQHGD